MRKIHSQTAKTVAICKLAWMAANWKGRSRIQSTASETLSLPRDHNASYRDRRVLEMEPTIQEQPFAESKVVIAQLNYLAEATPKPINYAYDPLRVPPRSGKYLEQSVAIRNGRKVPWNLALDTNGFVLEEHESAVKDFYDSDEVEAVYYPEI